MDAGSWAKQYAMALAAELERLRLERGISKNELAVRSGLARSFITYLEQGRATPSAETLARLGFALGISPSKILKSTEATTDRVPRFRRKFPGFRELPPAEPPA